MKKVISLIMVLLMCMNLSSCGGSDENSDPHVVVTKDATVKYVGFQFDAKSVNVINVGFNYSNTGDKANSLHFTVQVKAYQDGVELRCHRKDGVSDELLPGYDHTCTYSFILNDFESPVLIQYSSWGVSKVISEFTIEIAPNEGA